MQSAVPARPWLGDFVLLAAIWGASFMFMRVGAAELGPMPTAALRVAIASAFLWPILHWRGQSTLLRRHWRPIFLVGLLNTVRVALVGIVLCTILGTLIGVGRVSSNALARGLCYVYTEVFRNIPILLQLLMWYILMVEWMPDPDAPLQVGNWLLFSKMGLQIAVPTLVDQAPFLEIGRAHV